MAVSVAQTEVQNENAICAMMDIEWISCSAGWGLCAYGVMAVLGGAYQAAHHA